MFPRLFHLPAVAAAMAFLAAGDGTAQPIPCPFDLDASSGEEPFISWSGQAGRYYDLWSSEDLIRWEPMDGYPRLGTTTLMKEWLTPAPRGFFRMASAPDLASFLLPEVVAYKSATGITLEAANEINLFLRHLRGAGVEPLLFWVGGSRYNSINGSTARAVIGGNGSVIGSLWARGEGYETFTGSQILRFANPLKKGSQSRAGFFAGAAPAGETGAQGLITGGEENPRGPALTAAWGGGTFRVFNAAGEGLGHPGFGGFVKAGSFLPYVGAAYDGYFSVLCGLGKSLGGRDHPLRYLGLPEPQFSNQTFVNSQNFIDLGSPGFSGRLHFAVVTAADLTDNRRAYDIISIPRRSGFGAYGMQTAVVFLGDSITVGSNNHLWNSDGQTPTHKGGGQWNRNCLALLANATGEGNEAQIEYFEKGAKFALDPRTWDHLYFVCGAGGHYRNGEHLTQNPLSLEAKEGLDAWVDEAHERIAIPAALTGANVVQMIYIYGCPNKVSNAVDPEIYRAFSDHRANRQRMNAQAAGFAIFDVYSIPQLNAPIPAFYADVIHPAPAGCRLIAQEFAASVANPTSRVPRSLSRPSISGSPSVGSPLSTTRGTWAFTPTNYTYRWMRDATDIPGATAASYQITSSDFSFHISCRVTATNAHGSAERTSAHTAIVAR